MRRSTCLLALLLHGAVALAQVPPVPGLTAQPPAQVEAPKDALGRDTPRGTVLGFMNAARNGNDEAGTLYLNTNLKGKAASDLARQLFVVLDSRLPARLADMSDRPEGSLRNPLRPNQDAVGTIATANGPLDLLVERVSRGSAAPVWLFSRATLDAIPDVYAEIDLVSVDRYLPRLAKIRIAGIRVFDWITLLLAGPLIYYLLGLLSPLAAPVAALWRRRRARTGAHIVAPAGTVIPGYVRLLVLAALIRWSQSGVDLPFIERQFWTAVATMLGIVAATWIMLLVNEYGERYVERRLGHREYAALLRLVRRLADGTVIGASVLVTLHYYGVDPTAALAGLGIGGIAIALAAQKTLENVIGGLSIIFDRAVQVGDSLKFGDTQGTVDSIGLRSTRIRTLDRTVLSVPNGQIANAGIETFSARDKFWFHHFVSLRYETTPDQIRAVVDGIDKLLASHRAVERESIRTRFFRLGPFSLDLEVSSYVFAADWSAFLEIQEQLLLELMRVVTAAGTSIAIPAQTLHMTEPLPPDATARRAGPSGQPAERPSPPGKASEPARIVNN